MTTAKLACAAVAASFVFGGSYAFAASFGVSEGGLHAGSNLIAACGSGMTFAYTTAFEPGSSAYAVNGIELMNIPVGCLRKSVSVTFLDSGENAAGSAVDAVLPGSGTTQSISINPRSNPIAAARVSGVSVVVS